MSDTTAQALLDRHIWATIHRLMLDPTYVPENPRMAIELLREWADRLEAGLYRAEGVLVNEPSPTPKAGPGRVLTGSESLAAWRTANDPFTGTGHYVLPTGAAALCGFLPDQEVFQFEVQPRWQLPQYSRIFNRCRRCLRLLQRQGKVT